MKNRFECRAHYQYDGPTLSTPFRSKRNPEYISQALAIFPSEVIKQFSIQDAQITILSPPPDLNSCYITIATNFDKATVIERVKKCLDKLDLSGGLL